METEVTPFGFDNRSPMERRSLRPFKSSEEYLYAMKEDLSEWLHLLYNLDIDADTFFDKLETGVVLCQHANNVCVCAERYYNSLDPVPSSDTPPTTITSSSSRPGQLGACKITFHQTALPGTFYARANVHSFVRWCRQRLCVPECLLFETEDLVSRKNERHVVLCLLEVARRGADVGLPVPVLVQFEQQIERQLAAERKQESQEEEEQEEEEEMTSMVYGPWQQVVTNDLKSLDQMVRELVERCVCPSQFPMVRISEGKYRIGDTKTFIFVRVLRNHVMVRVGGGWDTLGHYLDKHDPCRCGTGQRGASSFKLSTKTSPNSEAILSSVSYDRFDAAGANTPPPRRNQLFRHSSRRKQEEGSGDSSSEVSDEGYRSQGYSRLSSSTSKEDRPDSRLTQSSDSSETNIKKPQNMFFTGVDESTPPPSFQTNERSFTKTIPINTPTTKIISSKNIANDENGDPEISNNKATPVKMPLQKRNSCEANRKEKSICETPKIDSSTRSTTSRADRNRTWATSSMRRTRQRSQIKPDTFSRAGLAGTATSLETLTMSPLSCRRQSLAPTAPAPPALRRTGSALLDRLLDDPEALNDDSRMLQRMHELVSQYRPLLTDGDTELGEKGAAVRVVNPRKDSVRSRSVGPSRIPAPVRTD